MALVDFNKTVSTATILIKCSPSVALSSVLLLRRHVSRRRHHASPKLTFSVPPQGYLFLFDNDMYRGVNCFMEMLAVSPSYAAVVGFIDLYNKQELLLSLFLFCIIIIECRYDII